ncbi:glycosyltransferase family 2 protein [Phycobacter azelaicus]|uniref:glycosyltransferase family 2 protein n=1 Tax=Phycobacter azelaicus TaxID=2668075 RepID=UPI0034E2FFA1
MKGDKSPLSDPLAAARTQSATPVEPVPQTRSDLVDGLVSVIMPVFNAEKTLTRAVASVQAQDYPDWELVLIEDGSSDGSADLCADLAAADPRIRVLRQSRNSGAAAARNAGLAQARGRYIAFLDADDEWLPEKLTSQLSFMEASGASFSYTGFWRQRGAQRRQVRVPAAVDRAQLLKGNVIGCLTALYDRAHFGTVEMPDLRMRQDFALWLKLLEQGGRAHGLDRPLAIHHVQPDSLSAPKGRAIRATWQMYRTHLGFSPARAGWYLSNHLLRRLLRG